MPFRTAKHANVVFLVLLAVSVTAVGQIPPGAERNKLSASARQLNAEGVKLFQQGKIAEAQRKLQEALDVRRKLYPESQFPDGHPELVESVNNVGSVLQAAGANAQAMPYFEQVLAMNRRLHPEARSPEGHPSIAISLNNLGFLLESMGKHDQALAYLTQALEMNQKLFPATKYPDGHPNLASSLGNLNYVLQSMGKYDQALPYAEQDLDMNRKLYSESKYPDGHPGLARSLNNLASLQSAMGAQDKALPLYQQALALLEKLHPPSRFPLGHPMLAAGLNNLGAVYRALGSYEQAAPLFERALKMRRGLFPKAQFPAGHPDLALSLDNFAALCESLERFDQAFEYAEEALEMRRRLYPEAKYGNGHPELAVSLARMQSIHMSMHAFAKALPFAEQALAMRRKLYSEAKYPNGHPDLVNSLHLLSQLLCLLGTPEKALPYCEQALAMNQRLYATVAPRGDVLIAESTADLGRVHAKVGNYVKAKALLEQSLAMRRRLNPPEQSPDGHPQVAGVLNSLGALMDSMGHYEQAEIHYKEALAMARRVYPATKYPNGHKNLAGCLSNLGFLMRVQGKHADSLMYYKETLEMHRRLVDHEIYSAPEAEALAILQALPIARDGYLTATAHVAGTEADAARVVWEGKAAVTRVQEQRLAASRAAGVEHRATLTRIREIRQQIERLLQGADIRPTDRNRQLAALADERDRLERALAALLPQQRRDPPNMNELSKLLPSGTICIDLLEYTRLERDPIRKGKVGETATGHFVAFVFAKDRPVERVDLGPSEPIARAVRDWRTAIDAGKASLTAQELRQLIWSPIALKLPAETRLIYIAPDGDLARIPWAALPLDNDRILLDDYTLATVPHAPYLLEAMKSPPNFTGAETLLTLGEVTYNSKTWPALTATHVEIEAIRALAPTSPTTLTKADATAVKLAAALPKARYAHLATHGEFKSDELTAEKKRAFDANRNWHEGMGQETRHVAAKNPLGFIGLVLSNGEVMSGLSILDLHLDNLKLVTLSACETGLGALTGGEGVQGLQRAFHLAGCPNVVASLWKVNDAATAALMAKFYHEMWVNKKPPIEALREAQLTIYRHPELIPDLAGERGAPKLKEAVAVRAGAPATGDRKHADTRLWAAFVLSGVGK